MWLMRKLNGGTILLLAALLWLEPGARSAQAQDWAPEKPVDGR